MNLVVEMYDGYASVAGRDGSFQIGLRQHVGARYSTSTVSFKPLKIKKSQSTLYQNCLSSFISFFSL